MGRPLWLYSNYQKQDTSYKQYSITNNQISNTGKKFDLEDRTTEFAKSVIRLCKRLPKDVINYRLISQLVASAGSIGANYR